MLCGLAYAGSDAFGSESTESVASWTDPDEPMREAARLRACDVSFFASARRDDIAQKSRFTRAALSAPNVAEAESGRFTPMDVGCCIVSVPRSAGGDPEVCAC